MAVTGYLNDSLSVDLQYTMLSGQVPFQSSRSFRSSDFIMQRITQGDIRFEGQQWESISPAAKELIKGILYKVPYQPVQICCGIQKIPRRSQLLRTVPTNKKVFLCGL